MKAALRDEGCLLLLGGFKDRGYEVADANTLTTPGAYFLIDGSTNVPSTWGSLLVFSAGNRYLQIYYKCQNGVVSWFRYRMKGDGDSWSVWKDI